MLHYQFNEIIFHIYMSKTEDIIQCHQKALEIYRDNIGDFSALNICAYFFARVGSWKYLQFSFYSTEDFLNGKTDNGPLSIDSYDVEYRSTFDDD